MTSVRIARRSFTRAATALALVAALHVEPATAQGTTYYACYVPAVGAMYMIKLTGLPQACLSASHQQISWTEGVVADGSITTAKLADGAVTSAKLAAGSVGSAQLATGAVGTTQLADGGVATADLASSAVTGPKLATGAVGTTQLADGGVATADLADGAVTRVKLGSDAITAVAWAYVTGTGALGAHSANVLSATWNAVDARYEISISGEAYYYSDYATVVTMGYPSQLKPVTASVSGLLLIYLYNAAGTAVQGGNFQFVVFR